MLPDKQFFYFNGLNSAISRLITYDGGCHSFDHYNEALADFAGAAAFWRSQEQGSETP